MSSRAWVGGVNSQADDPNNWSPTGVPQRGDSLTWGNGGTMDITGNDLRGDTLTIGGTPTSSPEDYVINISGRTTFQEVAEFPPLGIGSITINLADHAKWIGGFSSNLGGGVFITGEGQFDNHSSLVAARSVVDVDVVGRGTFRVSAAQSVGGDLEFTKAVGHGQSVSVGGDSGRGVIAKLSVDDPGSFHASTTLGFGEIFLRGLSADSYSIRHDMLLLYSGAKVVERLNLTVSTEARGFSVSQICGSVVIHGDGHSDGGTLLPQHT